MERFGDPPVKYRPEIDGLRAIAVGGVILFHAGLPVFAGGFVGVDIFFVISGYLITQIVLRDIQIGKFSFTKFYERRARRILPALFAVLGFTAILSLTLLSYDLKQYSKSLAAVPLFASNFLFWLNTDYFNTDTSSIPLLHTWSLAIEEQFYLGFPIILIFLARGGPRRIRAGVSVLLFISLSLCIWDTARDQRTGFYMPYARAWELMVGALLALPIPLPRKRIADAFSLAGSLMMLGAMLLFNTITLFPGYAAMLPVLGTALVVWGTQVPQTLVGKLLGSAPLVKTGQISYSLYLWHWPFIVFATYYTLDPYQLPLVRMAAVIVSLPAAYLSWKFIESPFRGTNVVEAKILWRAAFGASLAFFIVGAAGWRLNGLPQRFAPEVVALDPDRNPVNTDCTAAKRCVIGDPASRPSFILIGDSHAHALNNGVDRVAKKLHVSGYAFYNLGCRFFLRDVALSADCLAKNRAVAAEVQKLRVHSVILASQWDAVANHVDRNQLLAASEEVARAMAVNGAKVYFLLDVPYANSSVPEMLAKSRILGAQPRNLECTIAQYDAQNHKMASVAGYLEKLGYWTALDPQAVFCDQTRCHVSRSDQPLYRDDHHLNTLGAVMVTEQVLEPALKS